MIELLRRIGYRPVYCVWELTLACNMRCQHCGSHAGPARDDELDLDKTLRVADELAALGARRVTLSGGEPTLNPHWATIGKRLVDRGVSVNMISNGWHWRPEDLESALAIGLNNMCFSLDGFEPDHDVVRRSGSFERVLDAIDLTVAAGLPVGIITHINQRNLHQLEALRDFLGNHGVTHWQVQLGNPVGAMRAHQQLVIDPIDLLWLVPQLAKMRADNTKIPDIRAAHNIGYYGPHETTLRQEGLPLDVWVGCRAGCQYVGIESNGNIKGCLSLPSARNAEDCFIEGSLRDDSLATIWQGPDNFSFNRTFDQQRLGGFCSVCRYRDICRGGCVWMAYDSATGLLDNPYCFYRQAVLHRRLDLLGDDEPNAEELALSAES